METKEFEKSKKFNFEQEIDYNPGAIVSKHVLRKETGNVSLFAFDQGEELSEHTAPFDALIQVIDGRAEIRIDGNPYELSTGESIIMPANVPHAVKALDRFKMLLTMIKNR